MQATRCRRGRSGGKHRGQVSLANVLGALHAAKCTTLARPTSLRCARCAPTPYPGKSAEVSVQRVLRARHQRSSVAPLRPQPQSQPGRLPTPTFTPTRSSALHSWPPLPSPKQPDGCWCYARAWHLPALQVQRVDGLAALVKLRAFTQLSAEQADGGDAVPTAVAVLSSSLGLVKCWWV